jgi:hypothetical protein
MKHELKTMEWVHEEAELSEDLEVNVFHGMSFCL